MISKTKVIMFFIALSLVLAAFAVAQDDEINVWTIKTDISNGKDHPAIGRFPGSVLFGYQEVSYTAYHWPTKYDKTNALFSDETDEILEGRLTRIAYHAPQGKTSLELLKNYRNNLTKAGYKIYLAVKNEGSWCEHLFTNKTSPFDDYFLGGENDTRAVLYARSSDGKGGISVAMFFGQEEWEGDTRCKIYLDVVELEEMEEVAINADDLGNSLKSSGRVAVYDIHFDTNSATIKADSEIALAAIADLLKKEAGLNLFVVGHTDSTGTIGKNMDLSAKRAEAVVAALVGKGIAATRLEAHGVGPLAPLATNSTDEGRTLNRRVELVVK